MRAAAAKQKRISLLINLLNFPLPHFALTEDRDLSTCLYLLLYSGKGYKDFATVQPVHHVAAICRYRLQCEVFYICVFRKGMLSSVCRRFPFTVVVLEVGLAGVILQFANAIKTTD